MQRLLDRIEEIPHIGVLLYYQVAAFAWAAGMPDWPDFRVAEVIENGRGVAIRVQVVENGTPQPSGLPTDLICVAKGDKPVVVLSNSGSELIGARSDTPTPGLLTVLTLGIPTLILAFPLILLVRLVLFGITARTGMNAQAAITFRTIQGQLSPSVRELVRQSFRNMRRGLAVDHRPLEIRMDLEPGAWATL